MVALRPTPLTLSGSASPSSPSAGLNAARVEKVQPHLMPFTIEYHGPAPVSTFLLLRPEAEELAPGSAISAEADQKQEQGQGEEKKKNKEREATYTAAFRGRAIHGTTIPLPAGWSGAVLDVESEAKAQIRWASSSSSASSSGGPANKLMQANGAANGHSAKLNGAAAKAKAPTAAVPAAPESPQRRTSPRKKAGLPQPPAPAAAPPKKKATPAVAKRFTMDSDSDSDASSSDEGGAGAVADGPAPAPAAGTTSWPPVSSQQSDLYDADEAEDGDRTLQPGADGEGESDAEKRAASRTSVHARSRQLRTVGQFDRLLVWSPDGPVDRGDDVYVRTLMEWHGVIVPAVSAGLGLTKGIAR